MNVQVKIANTDRHPDDPCLLDMASSNEPDHFKEDFKRYKKSSVSDLSIIIDLRTPEHFSNEVRLRTMVYSERESLGRRLGIHTCTCTSYCQLQIIECSADEDSTISRFGLKPPQEWKLYGLNSVPGLVVIPNPFQPGGQLHWVAKCLIDYPLKPNTCNLDAHMERHGEGRLWPQTDTSLTRLEDTPVASEATLDKDELEEKVTAPKRIKLSEGDRVGRGSDLYRLRWVTLGYHYDWNTKEYYKERWSPFPAGLGDMAAFILKASGFPK